MSENNLNQKLKVKDLNVFISPQILADGSRKYRTIFDEQEIKYIFAEFSFFNKLFDEKEWNAEISLKAYKIELLEIDDDFEEQKVLICNLKKEDTIVSKDENIIYYTNGWGLDIPGEVWKKGKYRWEAEVDGEVLISKDFFVENFGIVSEENNPYFDVLSIKLFESGEESIPKYERKYLTKFDSETTRYVWFEMEIANKFPEREWVGEFFINIYNDLRQPIGQIAESYQFLPDENFEEYNVIIENGYGSNSPATWYRDKYTLEIVFMDRTIAIVPFEISDSETIGEVKPVFPEKKKIIQSKKQLSEEESILNELNELIGLDEIKEKLNDYITYIKFLKLRQEKGIEENQNIQLHTVFTGNPGTGKTTVVKLLGKIYKSLGFLTEGHVHEVDRIDLVGEFIGQTAPKTKEAINKARGGILFIDEAYSLARNEDQKDFGHESIEIILKEISDGAGNIAIIVAGYPEEMKNFIESNTGLKSRFNLWFNFPDYQPDELLKIAEYSASKRNLILSIDAKEYLNTKIVEEFRNRDKKFGNARFINSIIDEAKINLGLRIMELKDPSLLDEKQISTINKKDIEKYFERKKSRKTELPIDEELLRESIDEINGLIGLKKVKTELFELVKLVRFYKKIDKDILNSFSFHNVFIGNPGTGKTTVARIISKIYKALGILERGHLIECDRESLVAGFVGQTAIKTKSVIDSAIGGVLFIDEAYSLGFEGSQGNDFGHEAIEIILKYMEDRRGEFSVIVAGYSEEMNYFLESNPGLKSRFDNVLYFEDYSTMELLNIAENILSKEGVTFSDEAREHIKTYFDFHLDNKDKFFGNARFVRKVITQAIKKLHLRLTSLPEESLSDEMFKKIIYADVMHFKPTKEILPGIENKRIGF